MQGLSGVGDEEDGPAHISFVPQATGRVRRPVIPDGCNYNAHLYYLLLPGLAGRRAFIERMRQQGISSVFHYVPLHSSVFGRASGRAHGELAHTDATSDRLVRLPFWIGLEGEIDRIIAEAISASS